MPKIAKKQVAAKAVVDRTKKYTLQEACTLVKKAAPAKPAADAGSVGSSCALACSALASMNRAVSHLCALAGEGDRRCEDGRTRERTAMRRRAGRGRGLTTCGRLARSATTRG